MILIGNGRMITRNAEYPFLEDGCAAIEGNEIKEIGSTKVLREKYKNAEFIDAKEGVIMPGFINAHNHIYSAMARGMSIKGYSPHNFMEILEGQWWKLDRLLTLEQTKYSALATYLDGMKCGVTTVFDHHASYGAIEGSLTVIADAAKKLGVRTCLCYEVSDRDGREKMEKGVLENEQFIYSARKDSSDMVKGMMGMHAPFTLSNDTLEFCRRHTPEGIGYHIHVAEGLDDVYDSLAKYNKRCVHRLFDMGILGKHTIAGHCIHINEQEMELLAKTDTMVIHNPESNMGNAVGCGAVLSMLQKGILVGLGTDGYTNDMLESYKVANIIHKHNLYNPNAAWGESAQLLFDNNPKIAARFYKKPLGVLETGAYADIIVVDYNPLTPMNADNCNSHILFGMMGRCVVTTMINGKIVMKDRSVIGIDEKEIMASARWEAEKLWTAVNQS